MARTWSYAAHLGFEEAFRNLGADVAVVTGPWLTRAPEIVGDSSFDQVWLDPVHAPFDERLLQWAAERAPIRLALIAESFHYDEQDSAEAVLLPGYRRNVLQALPYLTHGLAIDEADVRELQEEHGLPTRWWCSSVPRGYLRTGHECTPDVPVLFCGSVYGRRQDWARRARESGVVQSLSSTEAGTPYPWLFDLLQYLSRRFIRWKLPGARFVFPVYLRGLRALRRHCFRLWIRGLQRGRAILNLPVRIGAYPGRVVEAMAAGRAVLSWRVPDRPANEALFREGETIALYSSPEDLDRLLDWAIETGPAVDAMAAQARELVQREHTTERLVSDTLDWITRTPSVRRWPPGGEDSRR